MIDIPICSLPYLCKGNKILICLISFNPPTHGRAKSTTRHSSTDYVMLPRLDCALNTQEQSRIRCVRAVGSLSIEAVSETTKCRWGAALSIRGRANSRSGWAFSERKGHWRLWSNWIAWTSGRWSSNRFVQSMKNFFIRKENVETRMNEIKNGSVKTMMPNTNGHSK